MSSNVNEALAKQDIDTLLAFAAFRDTLKFDRFDNLEPAQMAALTKWVEDLMQNITPAQMVNIVLYYETRLAKLDVESARHNILKQAVREVLAEQSSKCNHQWTKMSGSMAESHYRCTVCGEDDWR